MKTEIRNVRIEDAAELLTIYKPYVEKTAITFEIEVPTLEEFQNRITNTLKKYPYFVAVCNNMIVGYAYCSPFKDRAAYDHSVEVSIYLNADYQGLGLGRKLYEKLEEALNKQGILNLYACIASPIVEDETLTCNSIEFHQHMGYTLIGKFHQCGYKFDRWYDMVWMEKMIGQHQ